MLNGSNDNKKFESERLVQRHDDDNDEYEDKISRSQYWFIANAQRQWRAFQSRYSNDSQYQSVMKRRAKAEISM
jgi:hypothetical protein